MSDSAICRIASEIVEQLAPALDKLRFDINGTVTSEEIAQILWDNKIGILRCLEKLAATQRGVE